MFSDSMPSRFTKSCRMGCRPFAHKRRTRSSVSSPDNVVKSMQVIARKSQAICQSFFTVRRVTKVCARRSTALVLTRTFSIQSRLSGIPRFAVNPRPPSNASGSLCEGEWRPGAPSLTLATFPSLVFCVGAMLLPYSAAEQTSPPHSAIVRQFSAPHERQPPSVPYQPRLMLVTNPAQRWIQLPILLISAIHQFHIFRDRLDPLRNPHSRLACRVHRCPHARSHAGEQRRSVRCALFCGDQIHRHSVDVGLDLLPQIAACSAAT